MLTLYLFTSLPRPGAERVWCTKFFSLLLKIYFHLWVPVLAPTHFFRDGPKRSSHCKIDTKPIRYVTFHFWDRRGIVSLRHRNRSAKIFLVYEQKWTEAPSGKIFVAAQRPSLVWHWIAFFSILSNCVILPVFYSFLWLLFILPVGMDRNLLSNCYWPTERTSTLKTA